MTDESYIITDDETGLRFQRIAQCNREGVFIGLGWADESPKEPGVFLLPAYTTALPPPELDGMIARFDFDAQTWSTEAPPPPPPRVPNATKRQIVTALSRIGRVHPAAAIVWIADGTLPADIEIAINNIEDKAQQKATRDALNAEVFARDEYPYNAFGMIYDMTDDQGDAVFNYAITLPE
jgi:hypothetical protein